MERRTERRKEGQRGREMYREQEVNTDMRREGQGGEENYQKEGRIA